MDFIGPIILTRGQEAEIWGAAGRFFFVFFFINFDVTIGYVTWGDTSLG